MIDGFLGNVHRDQAVGWTYDRESPDRHLLVDIYCGDRWLGSTKANIFRADLAAGRIGQGDHGFCLRFEAVLEQSQLAHVVARARTGSDSNTGEPLPRFVSAPPATIGSPIDAYCDTAQFPVFVLGAPRSGTSAVAQALMASTPYKGHQEGQVIDLLTPLMHAVRRFYEAKAEDVTRPERITMIKQIPEGYFTNGICALFADAVRPLFPKGHWCDKTPTPEMIWAAPLLLRTWPNAQFIFVRRRAIENVMSRMRKFSGYSFETQCLYWTACMEAWRSVRGSLTGRALELDQHFVARHPEDAARAIGTLLALSAGEAHELARVLARHRPEQTGAHVQDLCDASAMDWSPDQWATFDRICGPTLAAYGYSRDTSYYASGAEGNSCLVL
jgi:Sulfotransferase family